jgi:hypothetical protein
VVPAVCVAAGDGLGRVAAGDAGRRRAVLRHLAEGDLGNYTGR